MQTLKLSDPRAIERFVLGGNSRFTIRSLKSGVRFTYRVKVSDDGKLWFVSLLTGPDNEANYSYIGTIRAGQFKHGVKSKIGIEAPSVVAFAFMWDVVQLRRHHSKVEFWHEGRCGRCSRPLTDPASIVEGFGPECITKVAALTSGGE